MTEKERESFERLVEDAELVTDEELNKHELKEVHEYRKEHYYHGSKKTKHITPTSK